MENVILVKSEKGVYKDFEDFFKEIVIGFNIKDKLNFRKDLEAIISTLDVKKENNLELYKFLFFKLIEKYGGE